jgi:hypothetical protein
MTLDQSQKQKVSQWIAEGLKLSEIQNKLTSDFGLKLTYMETRFLIDDLKLKPKDPEPVKVPESKLTAPAATGGPAAAQSAAGGVSVTVDQLARPGALVSGKVTFSDGKTADWYLDQTGRLGVAPAEKGYKPSPGDVAEFQSSLQAELAKLGY